ncbi:hypothetical protein [Herbaspirillum rubrisubalbicans]|uniref:hypothetical protein n=1 Tax=Herbaspirillum rubrisubalbicans TaxID=80842 RepID=UPI0011BF5179|nr:hypothetical protein [Herbaspirillum rubrisubalbicans]
MSEAVLRKIVGRYVRSIAAIEKNASRENVIGDSIRSQVKRCLLEMQDAGAHADEVSAVFDNLEHCSLEDFSSVEPEASRLLTVMRLHVEFLLFVEERQKLNSSAPTKAGDDSFSLLTLTGQKSQLEH